jgi:hypothetical protein
MKPTPISSARLFAVALIGACSLSAGGASADPLWRPAGVVGDGAGSWAWFIDWEGVSIGVCRSSGQVVRCSNEHQTARVPRGKLWSPAGVGGDGRASVAWFFNGNGTSVAACRADDSLIVQCSDANQTASVGSHAP